MSAEGKGLGHYLPLTVLRGGRADLHRGEALLCMSAEPIYAGNREVLIVRHSYARGAELCDKRVLVHKVSREAVAVGATPIADLLHKCVIEKLGAELPEVVAHAFTALTLEEESIEVLDDIVAVLSAEFLGECEAPGKAVRYSEHLRLVGEEALEAVAESSVILAVDELKKLGGHALVHNVNVVGIDTQVVFVAVLYQYRVRTRRVLGRRAHKYLLMVVDAEVCDLAIAKSRGPAVLVIGPGVHSALLRFVYGRLNVLEPLVAHILGEQASAGVHKEAADACLIHQGNLTASLLGIELIIPGPEGSCPIFLVYIFKIYHFVLQKCGWIRAARLSSQVGRCRCGGVCP